MIYKFFGGYLFCFLWFIWICCLLWAILSHFFMPISFESWLILKVHITQGDHDGSAIIVSWVTPDEPGSSLVLYGTSENHFNFSAEGSVHRYRYYNYTSGYIHHCTIRYLKVLWFVITSFYLLALEFIKLIDEIDFSK